MNKTHYLLLFILFYSNIQAQIFEFDLLTKYQTKYQYEMKNYNRETIIYANSKNDNYVLYVDGDYESKNAKLYDLEKMISYNFKVIETKIDNEFLFEFKYLDSKIIQPQNKFNKFELEYTSINTDSLNREIKIEIYKNPKRKKPEVSYILKSKKSSTNLFRLFRFSCMHPFEFKRNFNISENIIVESAKGRGKSGQTLEYNLLYYKEVKFEIQINTKPKG